MKIKTLVDAQNVIDRLLAEHMEAIFLLPDWKDRFEKVKELRHKAHVVSIDIAAYLAIELNKKVEIHE